MPTLCLAVALVSNDWGSGAFPLKSWARSSPATESASLRPLSDRIDALIDRACDEQQIVPLNRADDLTIARRLTVALHGRIPSLLEVRQIESCPSAAEPVAFADALMRDRQFAEHVGEVLAHAIVTDQVLDLPDAYRRQSFHRWIANEIEAQTPYDELVRRILTAEGLFSEQGAANFFSAYKCDPAALTAQMARSFLGLRLDCAQCHDHPFAHWKQEEFHGLASFFSGLAQQEFPPIEGVFEKHGLYSEPRRYDYENHKKKRRESIEPLVPFRPDLDPRRGAPRARLAVWVTHPENPYFAKAIANRIWFLMFGRGIVEPIDDLSKPESIPGVLDLLADDFKTHQFNLRRMVRTIAGTRAFQRASVLDFPSKCTLGSGGTQNCLYASFPLTRLPPKVVAASINQMALATPLTPAAGAPQRWLLLWESDSFTRLVGNPASEEALTSAPTLIQRLSIMNGARWNESYGLSRTALGRQLAFLCATNESCVEALYKVCLARSPTARESAYFVAELAGRRGAERADRVADIMWSLTNSSEFLWYH